MSNQGLQRNGAIRWGTCFKVKFRPLKPEPLDYTTHHDKSWPLILIAAGLFLLFGGFVYDVIFAGIPYQDPTPEMSARYAYHQQIASIICWCGAGFFLFGSFAGIIRLVIRRF